MDPKEVMLGNILEYRERGLVRVIGLEKGIIHTEDLEGFPLCLIKNLKPIPLSGPLMKILGQKDEFHDYYVPHPTAGLDLRFYLLGKGVQLTRDHCCPLANYPHITSLHQFQILFLALTGTHLDVTKVFTITYT